MVVCIAGHQNRSGKTTTAVNLATAAATAQQKTLLIDWDPGGNAQNYFASNSKPLPAHSWIDRVLPPIASTQIDGLCVLSLGLRPDDWDVVLTAASSESQQFRARLQEQMSQYALVLVDCPHSVGEITELAFTFAEQILLVVPCDPFFAEYVPPLIELVKKQIQSGHRLDFSGVLITMRDAASPDAETTTQQIQEFFGDIVFDSVIPFDPHVAEAAAAKAPVLQRFPRSRGTRAYIELCMEVLKR